MEDIVRLNWVIDPHMTATQNEIQNACQAFYDKYKVLPDTVKMSYRDFYNIVVYQQSMQVLDRDKKYGLFMVIPGGMVELILLEEKDEATVSLTSGSTIMVVESLHVDREFEKHILNKE